MKQLEPKSKFTGALIMAALLNFGDKTANVRAEARACDAVGKVDQSGEYYSGRSNQELELFPRLRRPFSRQRGYP
jgi:hypothetical protein